MSSLDILHQNKFPSTMDHHVGIEIEFISEEDASRIRFWLIEQGLEYNCNLGIDSSVRTDLYREGYYGREMIYGFELRIIAKQTELPIILDKVQVVLSKAKAYVNKSCGLHVHLDMRNRDYVKCLNNLFKSQTLLFSMVDKSRRENQFCRKIRSMKSKSHYNAINGKQSYDQRKTIEVRMHHGTIDIVEIKRWVLTLIKIIDVQKIKLRTVKPEILPISKLHLEWIYERIKQNA